MARKPVNRMIHTRIERDKRRIWHPVIEIRERGAVVFGVAAVKGYARTEIAAVEALKEAKRLEQVTNA